ncbi:hypothetical protein GDO81_027891 [Engystomops pustulosus]|uniref:Poly [ADP-ribose] polymerase n=1 Tax=Engystomops pustulosus TaxID=76066 RepID=A0AAV6ZVU7_ENGPU|nr:hypothetical protein GDO81_027891 [Engystomops pustulosus]
MAEASEKLYRAEYAKSGRASCKKCGDNIAKESLRLAIMVQSPMYDGKIPHWHHYSCFWKRARVLSQGEIDGFTELRWEDQEKVKKAIETGGATGGPGGEAKGGKAEMTLNDFAAEYAKSNRSTCKGCDQKIEKGQVRVSKKSVDVERPQLGMIDRVITVMNRHFFVELGKKLGFSPLKTRPRIFKHPQAEDKESLKAKLPAVKSEAGGLENSCHVLEKGGKIFSATLGLVDITRGTNSYYKLQLIEHDRDSRYWVFRSWGRVGTTIGSNKLEEMSSKEEAIDHFLNLYQEKTGNAWHSTNFTKYPNKFYPLEIDYGQEDDVVKKLSEGAGAKSKLAKPIQELIKMIFDVESMKKAMVEFEIDLQKMPLGKLSKRQIQSAYSILNEVQQAVSESATEARLLDLSNRFYTLIPHDFGMKKPPLLDNVDYIQAKVQMLDNLLDIEVAYSLLKGGTNDAEKDPIDVKYEKLKTGIKVVDKESEEAKVIHQYVKNTHAETHNAYDLEIIDIFKIDREGEGQRYKPFKQLHNRQLLWHGSRTTNFAGILSQGLRIAPPEAPVTGYMFGKGIYFADMVSKSANYCHTIPSNPIGLILLGEVALGNMHELKAAAHITKLPKGKHSVKGLGRTAPDPAATVQLDGVDVPLGKGSSTNIPDTSLLYNEYIVYDIAQVNLKYLLKLKFNYKGGMMW